MTEKPLKGDIIVIDFDEDIEKYPDKSLVAYHYTLMGQAGFLKVIQRIGTLEEPSGMLVSPLTYQGQQYIESIKDDTTWTEFKKWLREKRVALTAEIVVKALPLFLNKFIL